MTSREGCANLNRSHLISERREINSKLTKMNFLLKMQRMLKKRGIIEGYFKQRMTSLSSKKNVLRMI